MKILVFGAGAVGSMLGGFLARAGHDVALLGRSWHLDAVREKGLTIRGIWGGHHVSNFSLYQKVEDIPKGKRPFDFIILTVKSFDTQKAVSELTPLLTNSTVLVSFQNGLGNIESILEKVKPEQYLAGRIITGVELRPGEVTVTVSADALAIGALTKGAILKRAEELRDIFGNADVPARVVPNIMTLIWSKVIYNCALNGPCSILEIPYGGMLDRAETRDAMRRIVEECYAVGKRKNVLLEPTDANQYYELLIREFIPKTAAHYPSMLGDLRKGKKTEIDALNGAVSSMGKELGISTPENDRVTREIHKREGRRG